VKGYQGANVDPRIQVGAMSCEATTPRSTLFAKSQRSTALHRSTLRRSLAESGQRRRW